MPYCRKLKALDLFADSTARSPNDSSATATPTVAVRTWGRNPLPLIVGRLDCPTADYLIINQYSYLEQKWMPVVTVPSFRSKFALVQADRYLFILGGKDRTDIPLSLVSMDV